MTKRYFEKPCVSVVRLTADVIATSLGINQTGGNGNPQMPGRQRGSIWD